MKSERVASLCLPALHRAARATCRIVAGLLFGLGTLPVCQAVPIVVSSTVSLGVQGAAGAYAPYGGGSDTYSTQRTASIASGTTTNSEAGTAEWSVPWQSGFTLPPTAAVTSAANLTTQLALGTDSLTASWEGTLSASLTGFVGYPVLYAQTRASQSHRFAFAVTDDTDFSFSFSYEAAHGHGLQPAAPTVSFVASDGRSVIDLTAFRVGTGQWSISGTGLLTPDTYSLTASFSTSAHGDPLGDFESGRFLTQLTATTHVPETSSTLLLFGAAFGALAVASEVRRRRAGFGGRHRAGPSQIPRAGVG